MNLSELTNPVESESGMHTSPEIGSATELVKEHHTETPITTDDSRTVSNTIATESITDEQGAITEDEVYNGNEEIYENGQFGDEEDIPLKGGNEDREKSVIKERSTSEYRTLYFYLLEKYKNANRLSKVLDEFELYLKRLLKYQQLRNNMLIDSLKFLDRRESFVSVDNLTHAEIQNKLENILHKNEKMSPLLVKLIELEKEENDEDSRASLNTFHNLIGINDSLSSDLVIHENSTFPDLYTEGKYDFFELVKKNQCFENNISSMLDLQSQIQKESNIELDDVQHGKQKVVKRRAKKNSDDDADYESKVGNPKKRRKRASIQEETIKKVKTDTS
ncbi:hypothetical protein C6P40_003922 [Pichia californica]|uniref:Uncharacterized protein n=1 Tax=Pichia californica TaxID=460514 RepID=A0A9P7BEM0_9ASCO|nr:hypothetical protein C6P42_004938 [[Candida] californica]KAG0686508.1 hypothetical protein C6P40_003922 [[Candida] californica]